MKRWRKEVSGGACQRLGAQAGFGHGQRTQQARAHAFAEVVAGIWKHGQARIGAQPTLCRELLECLHPTLRALQTVSALLCVQQGVAACERIDNVVALAHGYLRRDLQEAPEVACRGFSELVARGCARAVWKYKFAG